MNRVCTFLSDKLTVLYQHCNLFNQNLPKKPYFDEWGFSNIDEYALHDVRGQNMWGSCKEFNEAWEKYAAENPDLNILFLNFEDILRLAFTLKLN